MLIISVFVLGVRGGIWLAVNQQPDSYVESDASEVAEGARNFALAFADELADPVFDGVAVSMVVLDEAGEVWFASPLAHTAMCPASALKVLTTGAALAKLGPDFRFETRLIVAAHGDGVIDGDLMIVGGGDPTLSSRQLVAMVDELLKSGIRKVDGTVRVDASIFPEHPMNEHWNWGDVGNAYGTGAYGLNVDHNRMVVRFRPGAEVGSPAEFLGAGALLPEMEWVNHVTTGASNSGDQVVVYSEPYGKRVTFRGTVPAGAGEFPVRAANPNPLETAAAIVRAALVKQGVEITGRERPVFPGEIVMAKVQSAPLIDIIRNIHHVSDNLEAQCLFLTMAAGDDPAKVVRGYWEDMGVTFSAMRLLDGSGLSRANMIRAVDLAAVMHVALDADFGNAFHESLPIYQDGVVRSKPGGMSGVSTSVGTIAAAGGQRMTYAFMANGAPNLQAIRNLRGRLRKAVAQYAGRED